MDRTFLHFYVFQSKGGLVKETLKHNAQHTAKFEFSFPVTLCLPFSELSSSVLESVGVSRAIVLQQGTLFSSLQKPRKKSLTLSSGWENSNFAVC